MSKQGYLEKLLDGAEVAWVPLEQVVKIKHGKDWKKLGDGDVPIYGSGGIMGFVDTFSVTTRPLHSLTSLQVPFE